MLHLDAIHHVAVICSDYETSKHFYTQILGFNVVAENFRADRNSFKLDLQSGAIRIELFSFPDAPPRSSWPERCGLRHLAFYVDNIEAAVNQLQQFDVRVEPIRTDAYTGKKFTFFFDPDNLPLELYEK